MKIKTLLIAAVMFLGISVAAFAQAQYAVSASPVTMGVNTGVTEKVGDIGFNTIDNSNYTVTGTITVDYGKVITAPISKIMVESFLNPDNPGNLPTFTWALEGGLFPKKVIITVTPAAISPSRYYSFRLSGVRVDVSGFTDVSTSVNAVVTATNNMILNGQASATVLVATAKAFSSLTNNTVVYNALGELVSSSNVAQLDLLENFPYAMHVTEATDDTQNTNQVICFNLDGDIPKGITLQFGGANVSAPAPPPPFYIPYVTPAPGTWTRLGTGRLTSTTTIKQVCYEMSLDTDITKAEHVFVNVTVTAQSALELGSIYSTTGNPLFALAAMAPFSYESASMSSIPRYNPAYPKDWVKSGKPIFKFQEGDNTLLLIPYAVNELGYDTGISIANTIADPGAEAGITTPLPQTGEITFYLYPNNGDMFSISSTDIGKELPWGSDGMVAPGKSYILLLSEILAAAGYEEGFSGYIIAYCKFAHGHGQYFVSDFGSFANGALMLVMTSDRATTFPESLGN